MALQSNLEVESADWDEEAEDLVRDFEATGVVTGPFDDAFAALVRVGRPSLDVLEACPFGFLEEVSAGAEVFDLTGEPFVVVALTLVILTLLLLDGLGFFDLVLVLGFFDLGCFDLGFFDLGFFFFGLRS